MNPAVATSSAGDAVTRRAWLIVLVVASFHFFGAAVYKYGLPHWQQKRVSEITIELGGSVLRGDGGEGVRQASQISIQAVTPTPVKPVTEDGTIKRQKLIEQSKQTGSASNTASESSAADGVQAAPTIDADYKAAYLNNPKPPYPPLAFQMRIEGTVMLKAHVQPDGSCGEVLLAKSSGNDLLDRSALNTVAQWKFTPAKSQGKDIAQWVSIPITFSIKRRS